MGLCSLLDLMICTAYFPCCGWNAVQPGAHVLIEGYAVMGCIRSVIGAMSVSRGQCTLRTPRHTYLDQKLEVISEAAPAAALSYRTDSRPSPMWKLVKHPSDGLRHALGRLLSTGRQWSKLMDQ
ncbi:hypothetical protein B0I35DRAFT_404234 [Stachybotrys elegans]|uniref:Uncharacterized protein n=1 Tax=Stachybotrys elegans TaxID=80388 RepID=A0A8K0T512_9HYPO|nr:hypothetical protein B0I35DRAFT_404234 [Stachybotrys elegans]